MNIGILSFNNQNILYGVNNACKLIGITKNQVNQNANQVSIIIMMRNYMILNIIIYG